MHFISGRAGEVRVRVLAAGVSFTDAQLRAGTYIAGGPKPPFTPGYELVGVVEELGPGCAKLRVGDRIGALTVWGADAETVCVPEAGTVEVPEDLDPAEAVSLLFPYMTSYQALHRTDAAPGVGARARRGRPGGRRGARVRRAGQAAPVRDVLGPGHRRRREARSSPDRLPQRGLRGSDTGADRRQGCGRGVGLAGRPDPPALPRPSSVGTGYRVNVAPVGPSSRSPGSAQ